MKSKHVLIGISLLISLFIYLFYRTNKTAVNDIVIRLITFDNCRSLKEYIVDKIPLNNIVIYSLPEGLWVFCITLTSKPYFIRLKNIDIACVYIPIVYCISLELLQLFHITNGRFDWLDIAISGLFWLVGMLGSSEEEGKQSVFASINFNMIFCVTSYSIVYLAHVFR